MIDQPQTFSQSDIIRRIYAELEHAGIAEADAQIEPTQHPQIYNIIIPSGVTVDIHARIFVFTVLRRTEVYTGLNLFVRIPDVWLPEQEK